MAVNASFARADCVVTVAPPPGVPIRADVCLYRVRGAWTFGGTGEVSTPTLLRPWRMFSANDLEIVEPARVGHPCTLTRDAQGNLTLFMDTEVYGETDCEQP